MTDRDPWACETCGRIWGVPSLARDCETRHQASTDTPRRYA